MAFTIRKGEKEDMQSVFNLITELAVFEKLPNEVAITVDDLIRDGFSNEPKFKTFVAEENEVIVGIACLCNYCNKSDYIFCFYCCIFCIVWTILSDKKIK